MDCTLLSMNGFIWADLIFRVGVERMGRKSIHFRWRGHNWGEKGFLNMKLRWKSSSAKGDIGTQKCFENEGILNCKRSLTIPGLDWSKAKRFWWRKRMKKRLTRDNLGLEFAARFETAVALVFAIWWESKTGLVNRSKLFEKSKYKVEKWSCGGRDSSPVGI